MGYHTREIKKGKLGEISKIREELEELEDAAVQENRILTLCELADLYGAIEHFLDEHFPNIYMSDLATMAKATEEAFKDGSRFARRSRA